MSKDNFPKFMDHPREVCPYGMCCRSESAETPGEGILEKYLEKGLETISALQKSVEEPGIFGGSPKPSEDVKVKKAPAKVLVVNNHAQGEDRFSRDPCPYGMHCSSFEDHVTYHSKYANEQPDKKSSFQEKLALKNDELMTESCPYGMPCMDESNIGCPHTTHHRPHQVDEAFSRPKTETKKSKSGEKSELLSSLQNIGSSLVDQAKNLMERSPSGASMRECSEIRESCPYGMHCCEFEGDKVIYHRVPQSKSPHVNRREENSKEVREELRQAAGVNPEPSGSLRDSLESLGSTILGETKHAYEKGEELVNKALGSISKTPQEEKESKKPDDVTLLKGLREEALEFSQP